jgi:signal transduction histidine kinase
VAVAATPDGAQVTVHNEGPAIPAADQQRLFRWFVLPGAAVQGPRHGWRLGMILVWGCVEAHGGQVSVDSRPEHGTTFRILLPSEAGSGTD